MIPFHEDVLSGGISINPATTTDQVLHRFQEIGYIIRFPISGCTNCSFVYPWDTYQSKYDVLL